MHIIAPLNSPLSKSLKLVGRILILAAIVVSGLGVCSYQQQCAQTREIERTAAFHDEIYAIVETYGYIHRLGEGRTTDVQQKLNLTLLHQIESLDMNLVSTDEDRAWAKGIVALIASDKKRHPTYYGIPGTVTPPDGIKAGRPALQKNESAPRILAD